MSSLETDIILTELSIPSTSASFCRGKRHASIHKSASIRARASFCGQFEGHYMSITLLEEVLGSQIPRGRPDFCLIARVTWHFPISDQGSKTSHLRVVPELSHDVVFGHGATCDSRSHAPVSQQPLCHNSSNDAFQEGWRRLFAVVEGLARLDDSKLCKKLADDSFIRLFASNCGFELQGELAVKDFASELRRRIEATRRGHQPAGDSPPLRARTSTPNTLLPSEETDGSVSSGFDESDLVYEGSTTSNDLIVERSLDRPPRFLGGISQMYNENISNMPIQAAQVTPGSSPTDSWIFVENPPRSPQATVEDDRAETANDQPVPQVSDFDTHPGHKAWVWDKDRQRWRRRGRSGLEETDWFPESFA